MIEAERVDSALAFAPRKASNGESYSASKSLS
jgi:hypothetical protein